MFEDIIDNSYSYDLPPKPSVLVVDVNLVTGCDTSAIETFYDMYTLCKQNGCKVLISGASKELRTELLSKNFYEKKSFFSTLELALGSAEDQILSEIFCFEQKECIRGVHRMRLLSEDIGDGDDGFLYALRQVDEQVSLLSKIFPKSITTCK